jgi:general secretion pathway protein G
MKQTRKQAFTLIELMVVVIIIAALAGMVLPKVLPASDAAKVKIAAADLVSIKLALDLYRLHNGAYPTTQEGLNILCHPSKDSSWKEAYLENDPTDPWKRPYNYRCPGRQRPESFDLWSQGQNPQDPSDDITNWDTE